MTEYKKCKIYRSIEWAIYDPNNRMLHLFQNGEEALQFFNEGMPVVYDNVYEGTIENA